MSAQPQMTPAASLDFLVKMVNDYLSTLPESARLATAAHAQQCLACVQAALANKDAGARALHTDGATPPRGD